MSTEAKAILEAIKVDTDELRQNGSPKPSSSWLPVDLGPVVAGLRDGSLTRPTPAVGDLDGGGCLFYPGKVNGIAGESGSGKSWTAFVAAAQQLAAGNAVVYIDLEDDEVGTIGRLLDLGVAPEAITRLFAYYSPYERFDLVARSVVSDSLAERRPTLAVVDSTGESLSLEGINPNADEEVARWFRLLPRLLADSGAAVVVLDHTTKSGDGGLWPIGSQRKRAAISGVQYMQDTVRPFSKDTAGAAILKCAKDRHGTYRIGQRVAELRVTPSATGVDVVLAVAEQPTAADGRFRPTGYMERVSRVLEQAGEPLSFNKIREGVAGKREHVRSAVDALVAEGWVTSRDGPNRTTLHTLVTAFAEGGQTSGITRLPEVTPSGGPGDPGPKGGDRGITGVSDPGDHSGTTGDHRNPCPLAGHSPRLRAGRWICPECEAA